MTQEELKEIENRVNDPLWCGAENSTRMINALLAYIRELEDRVKSALANGREGY